MTKKRRDRHKNEGQEPRFDFDEAKELTVGQAIRKNEEVEAGVLPEDSILDKYLKQHKDEIEADKFATRQYKKEELVETQSLDDLIQEIREETAVEPTIVENDFIQFDDLESTQVIETPFDAEFDTEEAVETEYPMVDSEDGKSVKKQILYGLLAAVGILVIGTGYYVYRQVTRSTQEIQTAQSSSSEQNVQPILEDFNSQYDAFYTDSNKTALKNSQFEKLTQLKALLDKLEGSREYTLAKSKYDSLETQIKAIQDVNAQFEKPAIVDGVLDTNAKAKSNAKFTDIKTGNTEIDKVLDKAISLGKSQQTSTSSSSSSQTSSSSQASSNTTSETNPSSSNASSTETRSSRSEVNMGVSSAGVAVQRSASRVSYNQSAIDDSNNSAWDFADGVLEQILATSRSRGYITGNQYILERVNIVNGNGYYNLYKPDGTYLFTLNCKTGYFVGNGSGHADALDY
ncbi:cell division site-positioning protein MapZ family protein [Streptococcus mitis]|uniref:cell division site-positioning protein MapZ n=1 Tax=Streptococcus mitis TaxID=28037 RepID=UPI00352C3702